ncbi:MAG: ankyrin repeat domain-containing protein [Planctomycetota bacterium]|nr:ankyrin repeat domain-containing protein [Planctomycetota bacterium]
MNPDSSDDVEREYLHTAAMGGDVAEVRELLEAKYPVNRRDFLGYTPLHWAVKNNHLEVVEILLSAGADVNASDESKASGPPLTQGADQCSCAIVQRLLDAGANPTLRGWMQLSAIDRAEQRMDGERKKILRLLREAAKRFEPSGRDDGAANDVAD